MIDKKKELLVLEQWYESGFISTQHYVEQKIDIFKNINREGVMSKVMVVGCDLETGGLNGYETLESGERVHGALYYPILEMAFVICDDKLQELHRFSVGIWNESFLERLSPWALEKHTESGLIDQLRNKSGDHINVFENSDLAEMLVIEMLKHWGVNKYDRKAKTGGILFGNGIGFDVSYLDAQMPELKDFFHYRTIDVSSIDLLRQTAWASVGLPKVEKEYAHTAMSDIQETLMELKAYTDVFHPICVTTGSNDVLMSRDNPNGWKLEELLKKIADEVLEKNESIEYDGSWIVGNIMSNNCAIVSYLLKSLERQTSTLALLDALGKDQGPEGTPRIGASLKSGEKLNVGLVPAAFINTVELPSDDSIAMTNEDLEAWQPKSKS